MALPLQISGQWIHVFGFVCWYTAAWCCVGAVDLRSTIILVLLRTIQFQKSGLFIIHLGCSVAKWLELRTRGSNLRQRVSTGLRPDSWEFNPVMLHLNYLFH